MKKALFVFEFLVAAAGAISAQTMFNQSPTLTSLEVKDAVAIATWEEGSHDFGVIPQGTPVSHTFHFTNTGNKALKIESVKPSCGCTVANYSREEIQPGETGYVEVTYNAHSTGIFTKTASVTYNTEEGAKILKIKGEVE
ncbi:MAG: DUF1573 domain-containing protein [Bacteroidia bacterium]